MDVGWLRHDTKQRAEAVKRVCPNCLVGSTLSGTEGAGTLSWISPSHDERDSFFGYDNNTGKIDKQKERLFDFIIEYIQPTCHYDTLNATQAINEMINLSETNLKKYNKPTLFYLSLPGVEESVAGAQTSGRFGFYNNGGWHLYDGSGLFNRIINNYPSTGLTTVCYYGKWGHGISSNHNNYNVFVGCKVYNSSTFEM